MARASTKNSSVENASAPRRRVLIVGGVAGGASTAARLRRLDEAAEIVIFERGPHVSFANCGLPYHVGNVIAEERSLLVASRELFRERFNIDVHVEHEVLAIDRAAQTIRVRDLQTGVERDEAWDALVLSPGAAPLRPPLPGLELPGVFTVKTIPDTRKIRAFLDERPRRHAVVVGGGFIGLEMAENLVERGLTVTLLEKLPQVMPPFDADMAGFVAEHLRQRGVDLRLGQGLAGIEPRGARLFVKSDDGGGVETDLVILALGVRPEVGLAKAAGLTIGERGGIVVDEHLRTSDPRILAVGDAIEVGDIVSGARQVLPLAGPANRQGRIAAETLAGRSAVFRGVQGTAIVGVMGLAVATTGASEKALQRAGKHDYQVVELHPGHHAGYYPGAKTMHLKLIFATDGKILGAQAVGTDGVDKRIDVIATMIQMGGTVRQLANLELCYAPQFGTAKDPVNVAGMLAVNVLDGDMPLGDWRDVAKPDQVLLDVREPHEFARGHIPNAVNVPLSQLRARLDEIPRDRPVLVYCAVGQRAYFAQRQLLQHGVDAKNLSGGYASWQARRAA
ncbi:MAG: FAD-dependent oxidoreductase [Deltaproteobacteria bacterium]|nr:FAD-dependent oxidoreductase [Deltaproteobacteria bacterium]